VHTTARSVKLRRACGCRAPVRRGHGRNADYRSWRIARAAIGCLLHNKSTPARVDGCKRLAARSRETVTSDRASSLDHKLSLYELFIKTSSRNRRPRSCANNWQLSATWTLDSDDKCGARGQNGEVTEGAAMIIYAKASVIATTLQILQMHYRLSDYQLWPRGLPEAREKAEALYAIQAAKSVPSYAGMRSVKPSRRDRKASSVLLVTFSLRKI